MMASTISPLSIHESGCLHCVCPHLDARSLKLSRLVCRSWFEVICSQNEAKRTCRGAEKPVSAPSASTSKNLTYTHASLLATVRSTVVVKCPAEEKAEQTDAVSVAAARAAAVDVDPLGEDNIGRQILLKMGWKPGKGLGLKGNGIRRPIALENEQVVYTRMPGAGLAHASELNPFKAKPKDVSQMESWEIAEQQADWMLGSKSCHWLAAGTLGESKDQGCCRPRREGSPSSPTLHRYVDAWDDRAYSEATPSNRRFWEDGADSPSDASTWEDVWAEGVNTDLDRMSLNPEHFFSCCLVPGPVVKMLHIEPTGEIFQSKVWASTGRELRRVLEQRLQDRLRVLRPLHLGGHDAPLSLFAGKSMGASARAKRRNAS